jgi:protein arginine N-methyltransferase 5
MDNLESATYETFEKDPVKYKQYQEAVRQALAASEAEKTSVVMVVGAGRGPLVQASLNAAQEAGRRVRVYAVEKNPNAVITLRNRNRTEWDGAVTIVASDMRDWRASEQADILVSELLGSFGDNELSPECLDGAQAFLKPDGISIPCEYTSYLAPISSSKLWNEVKNFKDLKHFETSYVVRMFNFQQLADSKTCFRFVHPNKEEPIDNERFATLCFTSGASAAIHGLAGFFHARLYGDVCISIDPETFSDGMFSWFPLYFPIRTPMYVSSGDTIEISMWRKVSRGRVWYEWSISAPEVTPIHNPNGRSHWIGLAS